MTEDNEKLFGDKKIPMNIMIKRLAKLILPEWKSFLLALILIFFNILVDIVLPLTLREVTNTLGNISTPAWLQVEPLNYIIIIAVGFFILSVVGQTFVYIESIILQKQAKNCF